MFAARIARLSHMVLILFLVFGSVLLGAPPALAQTGPVDVQMLGIDYTAFPAICLRVAPVAADGTLLADLPPEALTVYENGEPRAVTASTREYVGSAVAVVFDRSGSFERPSNQPGPRRFEDAIAALDELALTEGKWLQTEPKVDQLMLIAPTGKDTFEVAAPWTVQPKAIHNEAYNTSKVETDTPLYRMLIEAMVRMKELPDWERRAKFLLVFSDGVDRTSAADVTDVINRANNIGVKVLAVKIGPEGAGKTLQRLAAETPRGDSVADWSYVNYTGPDSLAPIYGAIRSRGEQLKVCYPSRINQTGPQSIEIAVKQGDREYRSPARSVSIPVKPPSVRIAEPADGSVFDRIGSAWDQDVTTIEPFEAPVTVEVAWPDGFPRKLERVLYEVDGRTVANLSAEEAFIWNFGDLLDGAHSLQVTVRDELGLEGVSEPARAEINIVLPAPPSPTPFVMPTPEPERGPTSIEPLNVIIRPLIKQPVMLAVLIIALVAAILALYALIRLARSPQARADFTTTVTRAVDSATQIIKPKRVAAASARAELIPIIDDAGRRGEAIPIRWQTTAIGRDPGRAQIVFSDMGVSRLHARIVEESDHVFVLYDEGSSSGTYVGEEQVRLEPRKLKPGDVVEFGPVRAIFQLASPTTKAADGGGISTDVTEPIAPRR